MQQELRWRLVTNVAFADDTNFPVTVWLGSVMVRTSDLQSRGCVFDS